MTSKSGLSKAYLSSGKIFEQVSMRASPGLLEQLRATKPSDIVVVKGVHDHIEKLLDTIKIPYTLIDVEEVPGYNGGRVMFVNCKSYETGVPTKAIRNFVEGGGRLVTTDWAVDFVAKTFPGRVKKTKKTIDDVVEIQCHTDIARRFIGLNYAQCHPKWWLEGSSDVYEIGQGVIPIITSEEMKNKYGQPYVAVGFAEGRGEVFHFISHLELQRTHLRTKEDKGDLEEFLTKMKATKTADMEDATVAELEAAYSTLNTLAHLCIPVPILNTAMKSVVVSDKGGSSVKKSVKLA